MKHRLLELLIAFFAITIVSTVDLQDLDTW